MSFVSSVALFCASFNNNENVRKVSQWLEEHGMGSLVDISDHAAEGGRKGFEVDLHTGGFNWLAPYIEDGEDGEFVQFVRSLPWDRPHEGVLVIQTHDDPVETYPLEKKPPVVEKVYADHLADALRKALHTIAEERRCGGTAWNTAAKTIEEDARDVLEVYDQVTGAGK